MTAIPLILLLVCRIGKQVMKPAGISSSAVTVASAMRSTTSSTDDRARARYEGLCTSLREAGLSLIAEHRYPGPSSTKAGRDTLEILLSAHPELDVVIFPNDDMAMGGIFHCMHAGITVREELAIFGFNGLDIGQAMPMPLSTILSKRFLIGKTAAEKLLESRERPSEKTIINTGFDIIEGATA